MEKQQASELYYMYFCGTKRDQIKASLN